MTAAAPHQPDRVCFRISRGVIGCIAAGALALAGLGVGIMVFGEVSPVAVVSVLFGLFIVAAAAPKLRPGPVLVCDPSGLEVVRLSLHLRWDEIERMRLTKERGTYGSTVTYLDVWPFDREAAIAKIRRRFGPFAGIFQYGGAGAIRVTIFLWSAAPNTVADEIERVSKRSVER